MGEAISTTHGPKRTSNRVTRAVLVVVLALAIFGAAFYYAGGMEFVQSLLGGSPSKPGVGTPAASQPASASASRSIDAADLTAAKIVYAEQIESQVNIGRLAAGDITRFTVDKVDVRANEALVSITATFKDKTKAAGAMRFVKAGDLWYFTTITGLRSAKTGGFADSVSSGSAIAPTMSADEKLAAVGVKEPDAGVLATIAEQQKLNQSIVTALLAGEYKTYELGKPETGASTFTIPVTIGGPKESGVKASIVLISKNVEGKDRIFITTFKKL
jgi:hypothetical protein